MHGIFLRTAVLLILGSAPLAAQPLAPDPARGNGTPSGTELCAGGVVADDGSLETGYGWVPSVVDGSYVQLFQSVAVGSPLFDKVCVCWLRTRTDDTIDFEVVFHQQVFDPDIGRLQPAIEPYAAVPAQATGVPSGITGAFYEIDVSGVPVAAGQSYVGVRWDASVDQFFFVCADQTPAPDPVPVFFIDDRANTWGEALNTLDPLFNNHHAAMIRVVGVSGVVAVPGSGPFALAVLGGLLGAVALWFLRR